MDSSPRSGGGFAPLENNVGAPLLLLLPPVNRDERQPRLPRVVVVGVVAAVAAAVLGGGGGSGSAVGCGGAVGRSERRGGGGGRGGEDGACVGGRNELSELFLKAEGADAAWGAVLVRMAGALHAAFSAVFMHRFHRSETTLFLSLEISSEPEERLRFWC